MENKISGLPKKILDRLDKEKVKQIPGWLFKAKNILFWMLWIIFVICGGSLAVSAMAFHARFAGWDYFPITHGSLGSFILDTFPYIWLIILIIFLFIGYENFKKTKTGYKYTFSLIVGVSLFACLVGGFVLDTTGIGRVADEDIGRHLPFNHSISERQGEFWSKPDEGLLFGDIISIDEIAATLVLSDINKSEWTVDISQLSEADRAAIQPSANIRLIGWREDGDEVFNACFVIPWEPGMRPEMPKPGDCENENCPLPPAPPDNEQKTITSCQDIPGYEFLVKMKKSE